MSAVCVLQAATTLSTASSDADLAVNSLIQPKAQNNALASANTAITAQSIRLAAVSLASITSTPRVSPKDRSHRSQTASLTFSVAATQQKEASATQPANAFLLKIATRLAAALESVQRLLASATATQPRTLTCSVTRTAETRLQL